MNINTALENTVLTYIEANSNTSDLELGARRELRLARMALEAAAKHFLQLLENLNARNPSGDDLVAQIAAQAGLHKACEKLVMLTKQVAQTAKVAAEIEDILYHRIDAAQVYSIVSQLPEMVRGVITAYSSDPSLAQQVTISLTEKIRNITMLVENKDSNPQGVLEAQVSEMLNSVPMVAAGSEAIS